MNENLTSIIDIAITLKLDSKIVAEVFREGFIRGLEARENDENIRELFHEIEEKIKQ